MKQKRTDLLNVSRLLQFEPKPEWFARTHLGVHGIAHQTRVLVITQVLCQRIDKESISNDLGWAASFHDTRRHDDWIDPEHGKRAAEFVRSEADKLSLAIDIPSVSFLCEWHATEDHDVPEMTDSLRLFKDADALDR